MKNDKPRIDELNYEIKKLQKKCDEIRYYIYKVSNSLMTTKDNDKKENKLCNKIMALKTVLDIMLNEQKELQTEQTKLIVAKRNQSTYGEYRIPLESTSYHVDTGPKTYGTYTHNAPHTKPLYNLGLSNSSATLKFYE